MDACYYSLIRKATDGQFVAWIPDLPGVTAISPNEDEVLRELSENARECVHKIVGKGLPLPAASPVDELPLGDRIGRYRRVLLILS
jgi:predicted RNase H-like HicB family nuclease